MRTSLFATTLGLSFALCAGSAAAQTMYRWTDKQGEVHYTDDRSTIPKGAKAETTEGGALSEMGAPPPVEKPAAGGEAYPGGQARPSLQEQYWRQEFRAAREKISKLEDDVAADKKKVEDPSGLPIHRANCGYNARCYELPNPEWQRSKDRLEKNQSALVRAREELRELERRAANDAVPLEWRR